jgi:hypothetical protein
MYSSLGLRHEPLIYPRGEFLPSFSLAVCCVAVGWLLAVAAGVCVRVCVCVFVLCPQSLAIARRSPSRL